MSRRARPDRIQVEVLQEDIDLATPKNSGHCMIADAIKRAYPNFKHVMVDLATIRWSDPKTDKRYVALSPEVAQHALLDFDEGLDPQPFVFQARAAQILPIRGHGTSRNPAKKVVITSTDPLDRPVVEGGMAPPVGALSKPPRKSNGEKRAIQIRTGQVREKGLRSMGR